MKINCYYINSNILIGNSSDEIISYLSKNLLTLGLKFNMLNILPNSGEQILSCLKNSDADLNLIIGTNSSKQNFDIKCQIADFLNVKMEKNEVAENVISEINNSSSTDIKNECFLPAGSVCLPNITGFLQGFAVKGQGLIVFLPDDLDAVKYIYSDSLLPIILHDKSPKYDFTLIKFFGLPEKDILNSINEFKPNEILLHSISDNLETALYIHYLPTINKTVLDGFISDIYEKFRKFIFSSDDISLYQLALDLLTIGNKNVSIVETITGGNIASEFNKCCDSNNLIKNTFVINDESLLTSQIGTNPNIVKKYGLVSVECAYEIASALLEKRPNDVVVVTCGKLQSGKNVSYIAIGDLDGIHVYKNSYIGSIDQVVETTSKCAVFYLIKKLKQNDLFFNKIYV